MQALNIKIRNIQEQTESINNFYKDNLDNILNSNNNDIVANIINTKLYQIM